MWFIVAAVFLVFWCVCLAIFLPSADYGWERRLRGKYLDR